MQNAQKMTENEIFGLDFTDMPQSTLPQGKLRLAVAIATSGRREILSEVINFMARQTRLPDKLFICPAQASDIDEITLEMFPAPTEIVTGAKGSCHQRNAILDKLDDFDVAVFFDDDYIPQVNFLAETERHFILRPDLSLLTGTVLADGATGSGISFKDGLALLEKAPLAENQIEDIYNGYGCNMAVRLAPVNKHKIRFDETLPLYGWLEDVDFSRCVAPFGSVMKAKNLEGVHLGTKRGRTSGVRFGYSQIANPIYLARKGTFIWPKALKQIGRNVLANFAHAPRPEAWIDRRGRVKGNLLGFRDLLMGRLNPKRTLDLN